jgi:hypothetical protein
MAAQPRAMAVQNGSAAPGYVLPHPRLWLEPTVQHLGREVLGCCPNRYKLARAFLWEYSCKRRQLAQLLGRHGVFLTSGPAAFICAMKSGAVQFTHCAPPPPGRPPPVAAGKRPARPPQTRA